MLSKAELARTSTTLGISMTWAESVKREFTERIQFTRNVGKNARMASQCVHPVPRYDAEEVVHAS